MKLQNVLQAIQGFANDDIVRDLQGGLEELKEVKQKVIDLQRQIGNKDAEIGRIGEESAKQAEEVERLKFDIEIERKSKADLAAENERTEAELEKLKSENDRFKAGLAQLKAVSNQDQKPKLPILPVLPPTPSSSTSSSSPTPIISGSCTECKEKDQRYDILEGQLMSEKAAALEKYKDFKEKEKGWKIERERSGIP